MATEEIIYQMKYLQHMLQSMDKLIITGTSSLSQAIKSIQCLRQHELPHHTWQKPSHVLGHDVLLI